MPASRSAEGYCPAMQNRLNLLAAASPILALGAIVTGCTMGIDSSEKPAVPARTASVEFLTRSGCANTPVLRARLQAVMQECGWAFREVDLGILPDTDQRRGYGTPTILVGGTDLFGARTPKPPYAAPS